MEFGRLIHPCTVADFFATCYERRFLHVARNQPGYFDDVLNVADLDAMLARQNLNPALVRLAKDSRNVPAEEWLRTEERLSGPFKTLVSPNHVLRLFHDGATIVFDHAEQTIPSLAAACGAFERETRIRLQANVYVSPPNTQSFRRHRDGHDVFILQIKGRKRWRLYENPEAAPIADIALEAGDLLYVPRDVPHEANTTGDSTIHITFALKPRFGTDLVRTLADMAAGTPFFQQAIPAALSAPEQRRAYAAMFAEKLAELLERHPAERLLEEEERVFAARQLADGGGALLSAMRLETLTDDSMVQRRGGLVFAVERQGHNVTITFEDQRLTVPSIVEPALLLQDAPFRAGAIEGMLTSGARMELVRAFVRAGYLRIL